MWKHKDARKQDTNKFERKLSKEILGIFVRTFLISAISFFVLNEAANRFVLYYVETEVLVISEYQLIDMQYGILGISFLSGVILFLLLFLFLVGERLAYIGDIVKGIDALRRHDWEHEIPLRGENELTELAFFINQFSWEEQAFQEREKQIQEEKITLIRSLSHDIRTPLTSLLSYSEFMKQKESLTVEEMNKYMDLVELKSHQIKVLTDKLLDGGNHRTEVIENGKFLMEQLVDEWASELEEDYILEISLEECPDFSGEFDIQELRRIFDNLVSNIRKYAEESAPVLMHVKKKDGRVCIVQSNACKQNLAKVESMGIGIASIRKIAEHFGGMVNVFHTGQNFCIEIILCKINT